MKLTHLNLLRIVYVGLFGDLSARKERLLNSTSADVVYACSSGKLLPGKHMFLGVLLKSVTGSILVVNLNRFGHYISNEKVHKIDIGMESSLTSSNSLCPDQIVKTQGLYTTI